MKLFLIFILMSPVASAREFKFNKSVSLDLLEKNLRANGFQVRYSECSGTSCTIHLPDSETKDPSPFVASEPVPPTESEIRNANRNLRTELESLEDKLDSGAITAGEQKRIIKILLKLLRISKN